MASEDPAENDAQPHLLRRFGLLQAAALNMTNMIGIGPFITIPLLMSTMGGGPQAMLGWVVGLAIAIPDGLIWGELGAALPGSGGTYVYLREAFGRQTFGRLMAFLFIWQFILSGPLEIASGYIGFVNYLGYLWKLTKLQANLVIIGLGLLAIMLLYRRITSIGKLTISLWIGTLLTVLAVVVGGAFHFNPQRAFDFPHGSFHFSVGLLFGLGAAARIGVYDYLGYYDICYIGDEVRDPGKVIPRSIIISVIVVALIYLGINLSIIGVIPWREFVPAETHQTTANFIASIFIERTYGPTIAKIVTVMILWTAFGSVFALLLGYSRIPYAAAVDGNFFPIFGRLHPRKNFPHISLVVMGLISIVCSFWSLDNVISALMVTRILVQFVSQVFAVFMLRKRLPDEARPFKMWLYPLPCLLALAGWIFLFVTSEPRMILAGTLSLVLGVICFLLWTWRAHRWPFAPAYETTTEVKDKTAVK